MLESRLQSLQKRKEELEEQIADLENLRNQCNQQIRGEGDADRRSQLRAKMKNYSHEIDELYEEIEEIEQQINTLALDPEDLNSNNNLDNTKNQQELKLDKALCYIDFERALETFNNIQSQFSKEGDVALFFMEEHFLKRGDLCLKRMRDHLIPNTAEVYRQHFRHCEVTYKSGNLDAVLQGIANFFQVKQEEISIELVINKIGESLQNNSVLFIEIKCDISNASDIDPLIPWFIDQFWQPLRTKVNEVIEDFDGIKVVAIIISDLVLNSTFSIENLSCYCQIYNDCFARNKFIQIPLGNWTEEDISTWLIDYVNPGLKKRERNQIANKIYQQSQGLPTAVCLALQQQWTTLTHPPNSG